MNFSFGAINITIQSGAWIPFLLMIPNAAWMILPKGDPATPVAEPLFLTMAERICLFAVLVIPFFRPLDLNKKFSTPVLIAIGLALAVYYFCWMRYFLGGRLSGLLGAPFLGLPLPMAVAPVILLVLSSYLMGSWWMFGASVFFGIAHIWVSALTL
ncbi:MAG: hypothetical protein JW748_06240 [Anaerolineales bacterium]|nr:hypothetical protein [Anaerolineales bacterium]